MKKILLCCLFLQTLLSAYAERHISIFSDHISVIARQKQISFREAAQKVYDMGYRGVDVWYTINPEEQAILDEIGFKHACSISEINFATGEHSEEVAKSIDFMLSHGYDKVLLVPGLLPENPSAQFLKDVYYRTEAYAHACRMAGLEVMIEDYDNPRSPCFNRAAIDKLFAEAPSLNHVFDSGNYIYAGDDVLETMEHFADRIHHVHLKDRKATGDLSSPAVGTGIVPMKEVITGLLAMGYDGWFTVEHFGAPDMEQYAQISINSVNAAYEAFEKKNPEPKPMTNEMSEYWAPKPKVVTPALGNAVPSDAIVLFDGSNLDAWQMEDGSEAKWIVKDGVMTVNKQTGDILTRQKFGSYQLHIEWCVPKGVHGESQWRGNSGVFMQDKYEVQILDSYENDTYVNGQAGSIYKQAAPLVNAMVKPGEWNVYDIIYTAPVFKADGTYLYKPFVTVLHNGIVIQNHTEIQGTTEWIGFPKVQAHGDGPIRLQSHGDPSEPISFRNIWIRPMN